MTAPLLRASPAIVVTRPAGQAPRLIEAIQAAGGTALALPLLDIAEPVDAAPFRAALARLAEFDYAVLVSPSAIERVLPRVIEAGGWPDGVTPVVVGEGSANTLAAYATPAPLKPAERFDSEGVLALDPLQQLDGKRIVIFRGDGGRELMADTFRARGAEVEVVEAYRRLKPSHDLAPLLATEPLPVFTTTSSDALRHLMGLAGESLRERLQSAVLFVSHQRIAALASDLGFSRIVVTTNGDEGMLQSLCDWFKHSMDDKMDAPLASDNAPQPAAEPTSPAPQANVAAPRRGGMNLGVVVGGVAIVLVAAHWLSTTQQITRLQLEAGSFNKESRQLAEKNVELTRQLQSRFSVFESKLSESQNQQVALEAMYQELSRSRDEASLADIEQALMLASQHLQLAGNVRLSLISLQNIDQRLQGLNQPQWLAVRRAIALDIEKLKKFPFVDTVGIAVKLDGLVSAVDALPLVVEQPQPRPRLVASPDGGDSNVVSRLWGELWGEIKGLVRVRRLDKQEPLLLSPEQAFFLRENLKLRLLDARMANLQRDGTTFRADLQLAQRYVERYFDAASPLVKGFKDSMTQLGAVEIGNEPPSLEASLAAVRDAKLRPERSGK